LKGPKTEQPDESPESLLPPEVLSAVVAAFYPDAIRAGSAARTRAQAAQSIATLFAGGVIATFTLTQLSHQYFIVKLFGSLAVACWTISAIFYMHAVGRPAPVDGITSVEGEAALVEELLRRAREEQKVVDGAQHNGNLAAIAALAFTFLVFCGVTFVDPVAPTKHVRFAPNPAEWQLLRDAGCNLTGPLVAARVKEASLAAERVDLDVLCGNKSVGLNVPRADLEGLVVLDH